MNQFDNLKRSAAQLEAAPILNYIRDQYTSWEQFPIVEWIIGNVDDDEYLLDIYDEIEKMGEKAFAHPCGHRFLFDLPLNQALNLKRSRVIEAICTVILRWNGPFLTDFTHCIVWACLSKEMAFVQAYLKVCGSNFVTNPQLMEVIVKTDFLSLMRLCKDELGADPELLSSLSNFAVSEEMKILLENRTAPIEL